MLKPWALLTTERAAVGRADRAAHEASRAAPRQFAVWV